MKKLNISSLLAPIVTVLIAVTLILILFTTISAEIQLDRAFWTTTAVGTLLSFLIYIIWLPPAKAKATEVPKFKNLKAAYDNDANLIISSQKFKELKSFCEEKNKERKKQLYMTKLAAVALDYNDYLKNYQNKSRGEILSTNLTKKQKQLLIKLNEHGVNYVDIQPENIVSANSHVKLKKLKNTENIAQVLFMIGKIITSLAIATFLASIFVTGKDGVGIAEVTQLFLWATTMGMNIFSATSFGRKLVLTNRFNYYYELYLLCEEFNSYCNYKTENKEVENEKPNAEEMV